MQERVEKKKYYIIPKMLYKEDYIDTLRRVNILTEEEVKEVSHPDLNSALREPTVEEEKKEIPKDMMMIEQSAKRKVTLKKKKLLKKLKANA